MLYNFRWDFAASKFVGEYNNPSHESLRTFKKASNAIIAISKELD